MIAIIRPVSNAKHFPMSTQKPMRMDDALRKPLWLFVPRVLVAQSGVLDNFWCAHACGLTSTGAFNE